MIALSSELSRRAAEKAITDGRVTLNGRKVTAFGTIVNPFRDRVCLNGRLLILKGERTYLAFNKPHGCLVTKTDTHDRPTIWEYLKEWKAKLNSVGRLDYDSEGLIILTDDGDLLNKLTHPKHEIWKIYRVRVKGVPSAASFAKLRSGVELSDGITLPAQVRRIDKGDSNALIEIGIREGRNRQVRRMCEEVGHTVIRLRRIAIGPVRLGTLKEGKWRKLKPQEINTLMYSTKNRAVSEV